MSLTPRRNEALRPRSSLSSGKSWRAPSVREPSRPSQRTPTDARLRRPSSLPRHLFFGRLVRGGGLLALAGLAAVGVVQVAAWVERSNALPVRTVAVSQGLHQELSKERSDEILAYAGVAPGQPLFAVDLDAVAARVLEHPFVASATVRRVPPDGLEINVVTREPRAALATDGGIYLVDAKGLVMKAARAGDGLDLPVITGLTADDVAAGTPALANAVALLDAHAKAGAPGGVVGELHVIEGIGGELVLADPRGDETRVRVGRDDVDGKMARLRTVLARLAAEGKQASFIYLDDDRRPERAAVRLRAAPEMAQRGGKHELPRERG